MAARSYDLLMPRRLTAGAGVPLGSEPFNRRSGIVPTLLQAVRLPGGSIGVHAAAIDAEASLCNCTLTSATKDNAPLVMAAHAPRKTRPAHKAVTCKFCLARLLQAGVIAEADIAASCKAEWRAYAIDYATRGTAEAQLEALQAQQAAERQAAEAAAAKAAKAAAKAERDAA